MSVRDVGIAPAATAGRDSTAFPRPPLSEEIAARLPPPLEQALRRQAARLLPLTRWRIPMIMLRGRAACGSAASALVVGRAHEGYWTTRFFAGPVRRESLGRCALRQLAARVAAVRDDVDLTLVDLDLRSLEALPAHEYLVVPEWVAMRAPVPRDLVALSRRSGQVSADLRRVRHGGFTWRVSHETRDFERFHREMYLPHLQARYGKLAHAHARTRLLRSFGRGGVLLVERDGRPVAGHVFECAGDGLASVALGAVDGAERALKQGAMAALYIHLLDHARAMHCASVDLRGTRASLTDGVLRYKRKWGAAVGMKADVLRGTALHWRDGSGPAGAFLRRHAPIFRAGAELCAFTLAPPSMRSDAEMQALRDDLWVPGLRALCVGVPRPFAGTTPSDVVLVPSDNSGACDPAAVHAALSGREPR